MRKKGQTLVEFLWAISLSGVIVLTVYTVFFQVMQAVSKVKVTSTLHHEAFQILEFLTRDLELAVFYHGEGGEFIGNPKEMSFIVPSGRGLKSVRYGLISVREEKIHQVVIGRHDGRNRQVTQIESQDPKSWVLTRSEKPFLQEGEIEERIISRWIHGAHFSFSYAQKKGYQVFWQDSWQENELPAGVRVQLSLFGGKEQVSLDKIILISAGFWKEAL
ncbi:MAG: hypothetical protein NUV91_05645 [Candidatus Omnitrophica bacterium]|nr:hypothetical protein [Candidatus Omnitrophota bacterium]